MSKKRTTTELYVSMGYEDKNDHISDRSFELYIHPDETYTLQVKDDSDQNIKFECIHEFYAFCELMRELENSLRERREGEQNASDLPDHLKSFLDDFKEFMFKQKEKREGNK